MATIPELNKALINESKQRLKEIPFGKITIKLKAIAALENNNIAKVAQVFSVQRNTIKSWIRNFNKNGLEGLNPKPKKGRKPKLNERQIEGLLDWMEKN